MSCRVTHGRNNTFRLNIMLHHQRIYALFSLIVWYNFTTEYYVLSQSEKISRRCTYTFSFNSKQLNTLSTKIHHFLLKLTYKTVSPKRANAHIRPAKTVSYKDVTHGTPLPCDIRLPTTPRSPCTASNKWINVCNNQQFIGV